MWGAPAVPREITCREFVRLIRELRDDELSDVDRRSFWRHRAKCSRCSAYLKGYELTISATRRIKEDSRDTAGKTIPESVVSRILDGGMKHRSSS